MPRYSQSSLGVDNESNPTLANLVPRAFPYVDPQHREKAWEQGCTLATPFIKRLNSYHLVINNARFNKQFMKVVRHRSNTNVLLNKREVNMAGYWPSSFSWVIMDRARRRRG